MYINLSEIVFSFWSPGKNVSRLTKYKYTSGAASSGDWESTPPFPSITSASPQGLKGVIEIEES